MCFHMCCAVAQPEVFEAQESAILQEFHSFLAKMVERVGKRATEYEAAAALQQASTGGPGGGEGPSSRKRDPTSGGQVPYINVFKLVFEPRCPMLADLCICREA